MRSRPARRVTTSGVTRPLAPDATAIMFSLVRSSTSTAASPVRRGDALHLRHLDALGGQLAEGVGAVLGADGTDHVHVPARSRGGHGLVRALAAVMAGQLAAEHGLAGPG